MSMGTSWEEICTTLLQLPMDHINLPWLNEKYLNLLFIAPSELNIALRSLTVGQLSVAEIGLWAGLIERLTNLERLTVEVRQRTPIVVDNILPPIASCSNLSELSLELPDTAVIGHEGVLAMQAGCPHLRSLELIKHTYSQVEALPEEFKGLQKSVFSSQVLGVICGGFAALEMLTIRWPIEFLEAWPYHLAFLAQHSPNIRGVKISAEIDLFGQYADTRGAIAFLGLEHLSLESFTSHSEPGYGTSLEWAAQTRPQSLVDFLLTWLPNVRYLEEEHYGSERDYILDVEDLPGANWRRFERWSWSVGAKLWYEITDVADDGVFVE